MKKAVCKNRNQKRYGSIQLLLHFKVQICKRGFSIGCKESYKTAQLFGHRNRHYCTACKYFYDLFFKVDFNIQIFRLLVMRFSASTISMLTVSHEKREREAYRLKSIMPVARLISSR